MTSALPSGERHDRVNELSQRGNSSKFDSQSAREHTRWRPVSPLYRAEVTPDLAEGSTPPETRAISSEFSSEKKESMFRLESTSMLAGDACAEDTLGQHLDRRLARLMRALGQESKLHGATAVARLLSGGWASWPASRSPAWPSDITDDHTPFEFSLALNGRAETVRILTEPQDARDPSLAASWQSARAINEALAAQCGAALENLDRVADLFAPTAAASARFCAWHSAILGDEQQPEFKIYLNPAIHGEAAASEVLTAALSRLGLAGVWSEFASRQLELGERHAPIYFSLDLLGTAAARVKIYIAHRSATASDVANVLAGSPGFEARPVRRWCRELLGGSGPFESRPPITCFALRPGAMELHSTTLHLPVRSYLADDFEIARRTCAFLNFPQRVRYMRAITALSERPLESGRGLQTYVSLRASPGKQAVTIYLAPMVYSTPAVHEEEPRWVLPADPSSSTRWVDVRARPVESE